MSEAVGDIEASRVCLVLCPQSLFLASGWKWRLRVWLATSRSGYTDSFS